MVDAESNVKTGVKRKRIRHSYPRREVYHRWIHSAEYVYERNKCQISGKGNCLCIGDIGKDSSEEYINKFFGYNVNAFAVIDRDNKTILISNKYPLYFWELITSVPEEYKIFKCIKDIPCVDILSKDKIEELCKLHLEFIISNYTYLFLSKYYNVLNGRRVLYSNIDEDVKQESIIRATSYHNTQDDIVSFVKKYKIKKYSWYNKTLNANYKFQSHYPYPYSTTKISLPTVKQIITGTVFNKTQIEIFRKRYFYTKYCYGRGIKFSDVEKYWNKKVKLENSEEPDFYYDLEYKDIKNFFESKSIYWRDSYRDSSLITWNDYIVKSKIIDDNQFATIIKENEAKSQANYEKALEELKSNSKLDIKTWRETGRVPNTILKYEKFISPRGRNKYGKWIIDILYVSAANLFQNTQLRLYGNNTICTSRQATVSIDDAIKCYRLYKVCQEKYNTTCENIFDFVKNNIKIGIYNLIEISYKDKYTDYNKCLGYKSWLIRIGCHKIWLDDFMEFVHYYHLENKFGIKSEVK